jgi:hypothetical protein
MTSRTIRTLLLFAAFAAVVAGSFVVYSAERSRTAAEQAAAVFDAQSRAALDEVAALRGAQQAYVAQGQGAPYWLRQAAESLARVDRGIAELAQVAASDATRAAVQAAGASLEQFRTLDKRARQFVENGQPLVASDLIFNESLSTLASTASHLTTAADSERAERAAEMASMRERILYAAGGAAAVLLLVVLLLAPVPEGEVDVLTAMRALTEAPAPKAQAGQAVAPARPKHEAIGDEESSARLISRAPIETAAASTPSRAAPIQVQVPARASATVSLNEASRVCAELARVTTAADIPALLARAAAVIDARGVIVWVSDDQGVALYPLFTHGYPQAVVLRLGTLSADANNATAAAWRTGDLTVVDSAGNTPGAIVAPIVTSQGCVGVLAAELAVGGEARDDVRAMAVIFAAQLATVVTPVVSAVAGAIDRVGT